MTVEDILARLGGCYGQEVRKGVLLADDVGLGKTTVAALVAWVFGLAGEKRKAKSEKRKAKSANFGTQRCDGAAVGGRAQIPR
ncbi:hypothetical protein [Rhodoferax sp. PAMC 29310]|uniref:hypothetical protein n=1 Tax=Rhodoferax sp. PAMC 29310 TaxID=2822760 RepID=UPI001B32DD46|nr:hypothetical protein [Rhodoferax sp. PAMC 29310]